MHYTNVEAKNAATAAHLPLAQGSRWKFNFRWRTIIQDAQQQLVWRRYKTSK